MGQSLITGLNIRPERADDYNAITTVVQDAFIGHQHSNHTESLLVTKLREADSLAISMVAEVAGKIVGHIAFSPVAVSSEVNSWYGLGPLSVASAWQRRGIGSQLITHGLEALRALGAKGCVVLGNPAFYQKFGFTSAENLLLSGYPAEYLMSLSFDSAIPSGDVAFHPAFDICS